MRTLSGNENFWFDGMPLPHLVGDFWAWSSSDLLKGTLRGALAEFIVATAIGENTSEAHEDRQAWDLEMICGGGVCKIEVKSSAYINAGARDGLSSVSFSIAPSRRSELGKKVLDKDQARRASDVYVFCLFASKDREAANPLILDDWQFIVIPARANCSMMDKHSPARWFFSRLARSSGSVAWTEMLTGLMCKSIIRWSSRLDRLVNVI